MGDRVCVLALVCVVLCVKVLYSRQLGFPSVNSEKTKIEVYCIRFSRLSPVSKFTRITGLGAILKSPFRDIAVFYRPKVKKSPIGRYIARPEAALNGPATDRRTSFTRRFRFWIVGYTPTARKRRCTRRTTMHPHVSAVTSVKHTTVHHVLIVNAPAPPLGLGFRAQRGDGV